MLLLAPGVKQRKLSKNKIEKVILQPDKSLPSFKGRFVAQKNFSGNILEVVYKKENNHIVILTAYNI